MCGITGIYTKNNLSNIEDRIRVMNNSIKHRGPDADGFYIKKNLALGHRRLSIIDTSAKSNQPMHSSDDIWHVIFNGEIYNFKEIKSVLNYNFKTESDTEVILAAIQEKGIDWFLETSNGMFSIALFNSITENLYLLRDRLGIKPLYYWFNGEELIFASEIKAILSSGLVEAKFNDLAIDEYLAYRYVREPYTFFKNIYQVKSGTYLKFDSDLQLIEKTFWKFPDEFNVDKEYDENEILEKFSAELIKSIKYRLKSDVSLGTYLSGGIDSSIITAITALSKSEKINTYTIGFDELNEFEYSRIIADKYDTNHHEILITKNDYISNWKRLIGFKDSPLGVPNEIPLALMSTKLKEKITVVLSGEGADELLGGYGRIFRSPFDYDNGTRLNDFYSYFINKYEYVSRELRDSLINSPLDYRYEFDRSIKKEFKLKSNEENVFNFFHKYHVKGLLQRVDITTMQASVEARVPFLDHRLIEFTYRSIPYDLKLKWNNEKSKEEAIHLTSIDYSEVLDTPKYLLKKLSYEFLPSEIIERKKVGFPVPLSNWIENLEELSRSLLNVCTWLKEGVVEELIEKSKREVRSGQILWMFINIEMFKRLYFQKNWKW